MQRPSSCHVSVCVFGVQVVVLTRHPVRIFLPVAVQALKPFELAVGNLSV